MSESGHVARCISALRSLAFWALDYWDPLHDKRLVVLLLHGRLVCLVLHRRLLLLVHLLLHGRLLVHLLLHRRLLVHLLLHRRLLVQLLLVHRRLLHIRLLLLDDDVHVTLDVIVALLHDRRLTGNSKQHHDDKAISRLQADEEHRLPCKVAVAVFYPMLSAADHDNAFID